MERFYRGNALLVSNDFSMKYISLKFSVFCFGIFVSLTPSFALMQASNYPTFEAFQASGDAPICKVVSDGCNEWFFADGEKADPIKLCKLTADFEYSWSCAQLNEGIMTIL